MTEDREILVDAIMGAIFSTRTMMRFTSVGIATFTGNQHNESWAFERRALWQQSEATLRAIYDMRERGLWPTLPIDL